MPIFDLFSKRQKLLRITEPEIYIYDLIPEKLKVQVVHIIQDSIGINKNGYTKASEVYSFINDALCREYGVFELLGVYHETKEENLLNFLLKSETEEFIDAVELTFQYIEKLLKGNYQYTYYVDVKLKPEDAVNELNERFKENGVGYTFESGEIIKVDSTYVHSEITKPTLSLVINSKFKGPNEEYLKAHDHYKNGRNKECLNEALKAFESTMKVICKEKGWIYNQTDSAKKLIQVCFNNELIPCFTQNQFTSLQNLLESGISTIRNKLGGHGQGSLPQKVDDEMTRYALNLTGSNIIFLIENSKILGN